MIYNNKKGFQKPDQRYQQTQLVAGDGDWQLEYSIIFNFNLRK